MRTEMSTVESEKKVENMDQDVKEVYTPGANAIDISPNQDKGVLKEIIKEGTGTETPQHGNKVFVHYTGKLLDGTVFDSSRDRDLFDFTLGKGNVIKAWDIGVGTMKEGEICMLTCSPDYAYGKAGSPPKIPPDSTLVFEVELIKWQLEDLSISGDGGILRSIIIGGEGDEMPNDEASVEVHIVGKCGEKVFEDKVVKFELGEGVEHGIVEGIEIALKNFKKGETSRLVLTPKYAFGSEGKPEFNIPSDSEVEYEVTLKSFEKAKESWSMNSEEKLEQSDIVKNKGTKYFKEGKYDQAIKQYKKIISYLQYESDLKDEQAKQKNALLLAGYLNLAACNLKLEDHQEAIKNCEKALEIEPDNAKGLFRRGQARLALHDFELAKGDFLSVYQVDSSNKAAQKQVYVCNEKLKQQLEKEKRIYRNMFEKLSKDTEKIDQNGEPDSTTAEKDVEKIGDL